MCYGRSFIYSIQCHQAPDCSSIILGNDFTYIPFNCESCNTAGVDYHNACQLEMSWHWMGKAAQVWLHHCSAGEQVVLN
jgi:hypothetical protein